MQMATNHFADCKGQTNRIGTGQARHFLFASGFASFPRGCIWVAGVAHVPYTPRPTHVA
jgi:hypothetical protein